MERKITILNRYGSVIEIGYSSNPNLYYGMLQNTNWVVQ